MWRIFYVFEIMTFQIFDLENLGKSVTVLGVMLFDGRVSTSIKIIERIFVITNADLQNLCQGHGVQHAQ